MEAIIISSGTLRTEDLIPAYWDHITEDRRAEILSGEYGDDVRAVLEGTFDHATPEATDLLVFLSDALEASAPAGMYASAHEGDPALIGFWPLEDDEDD